MEGGVIWRGRPFCCSGKIPAQKKHLQGAKQGRLAMIITKSEKIEIKFISAKLTGMAELLFVAHIACSFKLP